MRDTKNLFLNTDIGVTHGCTLKSRLDDNSKNQKYGEYVCFKDGLCHTDELFEVDL